MKKSFVIKRTWINVKIGKIRILISEIFKNYKTLKKTQLKNGTLVTWDLAAHPHPILLNHLIALPTRSELFFCCLNLNECGTEAGPGALLSATKFYFWHPNPALLPFSSQPLLEFDLRGRKKEERFSDSRPNQPDAVPGNHQWFQVPGLSLYLK